MAEIARRDYNVIIHGIFSIISFLLINVMLKVDLTVESQLIYVSSSETDDTLYIVLLFVLTLYMLYYVFGGYNAISNSFRFYRECLKYILPL